jgi:hypothetical protein
MTASPDRFIVVVIVFSRLSLTSGRVAADPSLILANGKQGSINARTTRQDLVRAYAEKNIVDRDLDIGEGGAGQDANVPQ